MKKKRWRVKTHYCAKTVTEESGPFGKGLTYCVKCWRIQNWRDVYPVGLGITIGRKANEKVEERGSR